MDLSAAKTNKQANARFTRNLNTYLGKETKIFLKGQAKEAYLELKKREDKESKTILKSFERVKEILKKNPQYGDIIKKELIPSNLKKEGITNLYRTELSNYWRIIYTITGNQIEILVFILNIVDHEEYNKLFGYRKK